MKLGRYVALAFGFIACFLFGFTWRADSVISLLDGSSPQREAEALFKDNYHQIIESYIRPINPRGLKYAGIQGMMSSLGDPHTLFMEPRDAQEFDIETKANFGGVGARLGPDPLGARIGTVFDGGPAAQAGVKVGDLVTAVNGKSVQGWSIEAIAATVKGKPGTKVQLQLVRPGRHDPLNLSLERAQIVTPTVDSKYFSDLNVGYISVDVMSAVTPDQFDSELKKLSKNPLNGLVIDMRGNPGGLLDTAVDMLSRFTEDRTVVRMKFREGRESIEKTNSGMLKHLNCPVVILMDEDTASAAEIFTGAMRDYKLATLVGTHSYGKAEVQNVFSLVDGASAKITIAKYLLPSGEDISRRVDDEGTFVSGGLQPDYEVDLPLDKIVTPGDPKTDTQLAKALEIISQKSRS